jgi:hypothetical protein
MHLLSDVTDWHIRQGLPGSSFTEGLFHASGEFAMVHLSQAPLLESLSPPHGAFQDTFLTT